MKKTREKRVTFISDSNVLCFIHVTLKKRAAILRNISEYCVCERNIHNWLTPYSKAFLSRAIT
jgi:hypothetical protein